MQSLQTIWNTECKKELIYHINQPNGQAEKTVSVHQYRGISCLFLILTQMKDKLRTSLLKFEEAWKEIVAIWDEHPVECTGILATDITYPFDKSFKKLGISDWVQAADRRMGNVFNYVPMSPDNEPYPVVYTTKTAAERYIESTLCKHFWIEGEYKTKDGRLLQRLQDAIDACRVISYNTNSNENETD